MPKKPTPSGILSHESLTRLFAAFHIHPEGDGLVLFGLRGCLPVSTSKGWSKSIKVNAADVDHIHMRCTLGIWDRRARRVFAAPGSTVPHKENVDKAAARIGRAKGRGTNQLEPGFFSDLTKGEHLQGKRNGHEALRQTAYRFYRRSRTGVPYRDSSPLFYGNPYDNLHCGWNVDGKSAGFSSAGCMVVAGMPHCPRREDQTRNLGPWSVFHDLIYAADQKSFPLLLAPGKQALTALADGKRPAGSGNASMLLFGSEGDEVKALQRRLIARGVYRGKISGRLDARTYRAWKQAVV
jgi:hypothetical protein